MFLSSAYLAPMRYSNSAPFVLPFQHRSMPKSSPSPPLKKTPLHESTSPQTTVCFQGQEHEVVLSDQQAVNQSVPVPHSNPQCAASVTAFPGTSPMRVIHALTLLPFMAYRPCRHQRDLSKMQI